MDKETETCTFAFDHEIPVGSALLIVKFVGTLNDQLCGFYRSKNVNGDQVEYVSPRAILIDGLDGLRQLNSSLWMLEWYLVYSEVITPMQAFPCWDEPAIKATFTIIITAPKDLVVLSNMPSVSEEVDGEFKTTEYVKDGN